jgi:hypothetical protein
MAKGWIPKRSTDFKQVGGEHYLKPIQPWDFIVANDIGYLEGNIIKYVTRYKEKGGIVDLYKAQHYLDKLVEIQAQKDS